MTVHLCIPFLGGCKAAQESPRSRALVCACPVVRGCHKDTHPFFLLWHPLSDVWWLHTNRHRLHTNRHRLHTDRHRLHTNRHRLHTNRHRLHTNRHRLHTNRHRLHTNRHRLHTNRHRLHTNRHRTAHWTHRVFFFSLRHPLPVVSPRHMGTAPGGGVSAGPRTPTTPPPPQGGLRPTVSRGGSWRPEPRSPPPPPRGTAPAPPSNEPLGSVRAPPAPSPRHASAGLLLKGKPQCPSGGVAGQWYCVHDACQRCLAMLSWPWHPCEEGVVLAIPPTAPSTPRGMGVHVGTDAWALRCREGGLGMPTGARAATGRAGQ